MTTFCSSFSPVSYRDEVESFVALIIKDIVRECRNRDAVVSEPLVAFMVKAVLMDKNNKFPENKLLTRKELDRIKEICVGRLLEQGSPALDTIKMQVFFDTNYATRDLFLKEHKSIVLSRLQPIINQICDSTGTNSLDYDKIYQLIISGCLLYAGIGSVRRSAIVRETTYILQTYFSIEDLPKFCFMSSEKRERKFYELTELVLGTRVYNFSLGFGGEGIDNMPQLVEEGIRTTLETLNKELKIAEDSAAMFTSLYLKLAAFDINMETLPNIAAYEADKMGVSRALLRTATTNARQLAVYLRQVRNDIVGLEAGHKEDKERLVVALGEILGFLRAGQDLTDNKFKRHIKELARLWMRFTQNVAYIAMLSNVLNSLRQFSFRRYVILDESRLLNLIHKAEIVCDEKRKMATGKVIPRDENKANWIFPTPGTEVKVDLNGFCAWSIVRYQGLAIPCTPWIGLYVYRGKRFGFSSVDAAMVFDSAPEKFIKEINEVTRQHPELIELLSMTSTSKEGYSFSIDDPSIAETAKVTEQGTQTVCHPIKSHIDSEYCWNEWDLRRRALQLLKHQLDPLANYRLQKFGMMDEECEETYIRKCVTHSVQTRMSNFRRENVTQVHPPKDVSTQSKKDNYSQVPRPVTYLYGLRGGVSVGKAVGAEEAIKDAPYSNWCKTHRTVDATRVDLTLPIEDHMCGTNSSTIITGGTTSERTAATD